MSFTKLGGSGGFAYNRFLVLAGNGTSEGSGADKGRVESTTSRQQ